MGFVLFCFSFSRAKCFRGKKVLGDYDIKVEQVISLKPRAAFPSSVLIGPPHPWHSRVNHLVLLSGVQCVSLGSRLSLPPHHFPRVFLFMRHSPEGCYLSISLIFYLGFGVHREAISVALRALIQCRVLRLRKTLEEYLPRTLATAPCCWRHDIPG